MDEVKISIEAIGAEEVPGVEKGILFTLTVNSDPQGLLFSIDDTQMLTTPYTQPLQQGTHTLKMPDKTPDGRPFQNWEDGSTSPTRTINLTAAMTVKATYAAPKQYTLTVDSDPQNLLFSINDMQFTTPYSQALQEGTYKIVMPDATYDGRPFQDWEDGSTNPTHTINLATDTALKATYKSAAPVTPVTHILQVDSDPQNLTFTINDLGATTPYSQELQDGTYTLKMPDATADGRPFQSWEDGSTSPTRTINLTVNMAVKATYSEAPKHVSDCEQQYGNWGLFNGLRDLICTLQEISTKSE